MRKILQQAEHRPWPMPKQMWLWYQEWNNTVFIHGRVNAAWLRKQVPAQLEIDVLDGSAWISIVAFRMQRIRPRFLPAVSAMSNFTEVNIRTYVTLQGKPGVYFISMEGDNQPAVFLARAISGLPYYFSANKMNLQQLTGPFLAFDFEPGEAITDRTTADLWLTERYCLYYEHRSGIYRYDIHHLPWPLQQVQLSNLQMAYPLMANMPQPFVAERFHYSPGVRVAAWAAVEVL